MYIVIDGHVDFICYMKHDLDKQLLKKIDIDMGTKEVVNRLLRFKH